MLDIVSVMTYRPYIDGHVVTCDHPECKVSLEYETRKTGKQAWDWFVARGWKMTRDKQTYCSWIHRRSALNPRHGQLRDYVSGEH